MPNEYPKAYRRNRTLAGFIVLRITKSIPNDPVMRYICNNNVAHFYMYDQNQWWWCGYYLESFNMNMPNEYPVDYRNKMARLSFTTLGPAEIIPNDPAMRYNRNGDTAHFYMCRQNQWRWCGYCFCWIKDI
jgi:hypothetical protein